MLKFFRHKNIAKLIFWMLVILILPAFVLWGTGSISRSKEKGPSCVGIINGRKVSFDEFAESVAAIKCQIMLTSFARPAVLDAFMKNKPFLGKLAWSRLVMLKESRRRGLRVPDTEVVNLIKSHPLFLRNGYFDEKIYNYVLRNNLGLDPRNFEEIFRENLAIRQLNELAAKDVAVSKEEIAQDYKRDNGKFKIAYVVFPLSDFLDKVTVSEAEIKDYYEKNKGAFALPPQKDEPNNAQRFSRLEDVKANIASLLSEDKAAAVAEKGAEEAFAKIVQRMAGGKASFEDAAAALGMKIRRTDLFSRSDYLEGIGEAKEIVDRLVRLKTDQLSTPLKVRKGVLIFKLMETQNFDEEKFKKDKTEYSQKTLDEKRNKFLEGWLRQLESSTALNIDLGEYDKYYR